ncbi:hypothetical protein [Spirochaeta lutea]|uniref:hypothetical protein n=1 Tax=Spirochaeta lutea TaxID=1480694 RepID=UPI00068A1BE2|nr:hypothetical protein [Spirochaeta lutea]
MHDARVWIRRICIILMFLVLGSGTAWTEEYTGPPGTPISPTYQLDYLQQAAREAEGDDSKKDTGDEFPQWAQVLRRGEVIAIGFFPFAFLVTQFTYDIGRYLVFTIEGRDVAPRYAPFIFSPPDKPSNTTEENLGILVSSAALSIVVAIIDGIIDHQAAKGVSNNED